MRLSLENVHGEFMQESADSKNADKAAILLNRFGSAETFGEGHGGFAATE